MSHERFADISFRLTLVVLAFLAAGYFTAPILSGDFWWHLASGRHLAESGALPHTDPFGIYTASGFWADTVLKGQWLGQLSLFGVFELGGFNGVVALRAALLFFCVGTLIFRSRVTRGHYVAIAAFVFVAVMAMRGHLNARPQLFSFAFFALTVVLIERFHLDARRSALYPLPLLFVLWANVHPGVILGVAFLALFTAFYALETRVVKGLHLRSMEFGPLMAITGLCGLASLITPNGITSYQYLLKLQGSGIQDLVTEYLSPFPPFFNLANGPYLPFYWLLCLAALIAVFFLIRKRQYVEAALTAVIVVISFEAYRYIPFMLIYSVPVIVRAIGAPIDRLTGRFRPWLLGGFAMFFAASLAAGSIQGKTFRGHFAEGFYPVELSRMVEKHKLQGRMFNTLNWGGYLTWRLWPEVRVFIDGRLIELERVQAYTHVLWLTDYGRRFFEQADFAMVLVAHRNAFNPDVRPYPLVEHLRRDPQWRLIKLTDTGVLFARREEPLNPRPKPDNK